MGVIALFSGQSLYDPSIDSLFNIVFTAYPIGWFATYDKEISYDELETRGDLYESGIKNKDFNFYVFWRWYLYAGTAGGLIFISIACILTWDLNAYDEMIDFWGLGATTYYCIVLVVNFKILIATNTHNGLSIFLFVASIASYIIVLILASEIKTTNFFGLRHVIFTNFRFYLLMLFIVISCILVEYGWKIIHYIIEDVIVKNINKMNEKFENTPSLYSKPIENIAVSEFEVKLEADKTFENDKVKDYEEVFPKEEIRIKENYLDNIPSRQTLNERRKSLVNEDNKCK
jgi:magnesium-transporting ATPase (P-type)